jgi:CRP/FNR family transcriptional regulator, cyclic AMP receptor protein
LPLVDASQIADVLAHSPVFAPLGQRERLELAARMRSKHFQRNEVIFHRDDAAGHVYLIASGTVKVSVPEEGGQEVVIALHRGGDVFGEISLFDEGARSATVTAITETVAFALANRDFMDVLRGNPDAMRQLLALLATRIRRSTGHIEDLVFLDLPGRVAKLLLDQGEHFGSSVVSLTQEDLASFAGATRVAVNRVLVDLERRGAVKLGRGHVEISDAALLKKEIRY